MSEGVVAGIDGFKRGWLVALWRGPGHQPDVCALPSLVDAETILPAETQVVAVDIPLGLLDTAMPGGRPCDVQARVFLKGKTSSVFSPPALPTLRASTFDEACRVNAESSPYGIKLSRQSFELLPKLRDAEMASTVSAWLRERIVEAHPEVSFGKLAGMPVLSRKRDTAGQEERRALLAQAGFKNLAIFERRARELGAAKDDALDACAAAWTAHRRRTGTAGCFPQNAIGSDRAMRIWY